MPVTNGHCTAMYDLSIDLGGDFAAWQTYHVDVNGKVTTLYID
jgi:hypothetical protein